MIVAPSSQDLVQLHGETGAHGQLNVWIPPSGQRAGRACQQGGGEPPPCLLLPELGGLGEVSSMG